MKATIATAAAILAASTIAASAADMAVKARPVVPPPVVWSWTGFYFGGHVGAGWGTTESTLTNIGINQFNIPLNLPFSQNSRSGFLGGVQAGYNWQSGPIVFGVQGDVAWTDISGTTPCVVILNCTTDTNWLATFTGRLGAVVLDRGLIYVKGGGAWANHDHTVRTFGIGPIGGLNFPPQTLAAFSSDTWGWTVGFGTEWMISPNWTAFIEYNYIDFDTTRSTFPINNFGARVAVNATADLTHKLSIAKVGVNYKFDWGKAPLVARY